MKFLLNEDLPQNLRAALEQEAKEVDIAPADLAVQILCGHFQLETPPVAPYRPLPEFVKLWVPDELHTKIRLEAAQTSGYTMRGITLGVLLRHYDLEPISPTRKPRSRA